MALRSKSRKIIGGRYAYEKPLGKGAGGAVYLAEDLFSEDSRFVALKVITAEAANSIQGTMLRREFEILTGLDHRNLVHVYDYGTLPGGGIYLAEEFIDGFSLQDARALLDPSQLIEITLQILEGLAYMHAMGAVHRDIKPANVMILWPDDPNSQPLTKLVDFGLSSRNSSSDTLRGGTRSYMAPEVVRGDSAEFRSDLYSLGVTLYYAMSGVIPFGPRSKDDPPTTDEAFRPPEPHRINPSVPLSLSRFTMILLRQVPGIDMYDAGQALRSLIEDVDERTHNDLQQFNVDIASSSVLRGNFESGLIIFRDERRKKEEIFKDKPLTEPGRFIVLSGGPDVGKSQLLRSIASDYKVAGATVLEVRHSFATRRFGFAIDIVSQMVSLIRSGSIKGVNHVSYFVGIITTLAQCLDNKENPQSADMSEIPVRLHEAFLYLRSLLNPKHLVIIMDDIDQVELASIQNIVKNIDSQPKMTNTTIIVAGRNSEQIDTALKLPSAEHFPLSGYELPDLNHFIFQQLGLKLPVADITNFYNCGDDDTAFILEISNLLIEEGFLKQQSVSKWTFDLEGVKQYHIPRTLTEAIEKRLSNLSPDTRTIVELFSLVRTRLERSIVRDIILAEGVDEEPEQILNQLQNRNYIVFDFLPDGCFLRVTNHELQYYVKKSLSKTVRQSYHAKIATHMVQAWDNGKVTFLSMARHFDQAGKNYRWEASVYYEEAANALLMEAPGSDSKFILDAVAYYERSLELSEKHTHIDRRCILNRKVELANALLQLGKVERARLLLNEIWEELLHIPNSNDWLKYTVVAAGMRAEVVGGTPLRLDEWEERLGKHLPYLIHQPEVALIRAWRSRIHGNFGLAFELVRRAKIRSELFYSRTVIESEAALGRLYEDVGQLKLAYRHFEHALELAKLNDLETEQAVASIGIGSILIRSNRLPEAENFIFEGFNSAVRAGRPDLTAEALIEEGQILSKLGSFRDAAQRAQDAYNVSELVHHRELQGRSQILLATILGHQGKLDEAIEILHHLVEISAPDPSYSFTFRTELQKVLGRMMVDNGQEQGKYLYEKALSIEQSLDVRTTITDLTNVLNFSFKPTKKE